MSTLKKGIEETAGNAHGECKGKSDYDLYTHMASVNSSSVHAHGECKQPPLLLWAATSPSWASAAHGQKPL